MPYRTLYLRPRPGTWIDQIEVSSGRDLQIMYIFPPLFLSFAVIPAEVGGHHAIPGPMNEPLRGCPRDRSSNGIGFAIVLRNFARRAAKEGHDGVVAQMELPSLGKIDDAGERENPGQGRFVGGQTQSKLSASRMAHDQHFGGVEVVSLPELSNEAIGIANVFERARPTSPGLPTRRYSTFQVTKPC